jgi:hypothetical protein
MKWESLQPGGKSYRTKAEVEHRVAREDDILNDLLFADFIEEIEAEGVDKALQTVVGDVEDSPWHRLLELEWIREDLVQRGEVEEAV